MFMAPIAGILKCRTAIMSIISSMVTSTIHTEITATTTDR
jgi:hypothetical protein